MNFSNVSPPGNEPWVYSIKQLISSHLISLSHSLLFFLLFIFRGGGLAVVCLVLIFVWFVCIHVCACLGKSSIVSYFNELSLVSDDLFVRF